MAEVKQAAPSASNRPPALLQILFLVRRVWSDSTPSERLPGQNERVQGERRSQRRPPLPRCGNLVDATFTVSFRFGFRANSCAA